MGCASSAPLVQQGLDAAKKAVSREKDNAAAKGRIAAETMSESTGTLMDNVVHVKDDAVEKLQDIGETIKENVEEVVEDIEDKVDELMGKTKDEVDEKKEELKEMVESFDETTKDKEKETQEEEGEEEGENSKSETTSPETREEVSPPPVNTDDDETKSPIPAKDESRAGSAATVVIGRHAHTPEIWSRSNLTSPGGTSDLREMKSEIERELSEAGIYVSASFASELTRPNTQEYDDRMIGNLNKDEEEDVANSRSFYGSKSELQNEEASCLLGSSEFVEPRQDSGRSAQSEKSVAPREEALQRSPSMETIHQHEHFDGTVSSIEPKDENLVSNTHSTEPHQVDESYRHSTGLKLEEPFNKATSVEPKRQEEETVFRPLSMKPKQEENAINRPPSTETNQHEQTVSRPPSIDPKHEQKAISRPPSMESKQEEKEEAVPRAQSIDPKHEQKAMSRPPSMESKQEEKEEAVPRAQSIDPKHEQKAISRPPSMESKQEEKEEAVPKAQSIDPKQEEKEISRPPSMESKQGENIGEIPPSMEEADLNHLNDNDDATSLIASTPKTPQSLDEFYSKVTVVHPKDRSASAMSLAGSLEHPPTPYPIDDCQKTPGSVDVVNEPDEPTICEEESKEILSESKNGKAEKREHNFEEQKDGEALHDDDEKVEENKEKDEDAKSSDRVSLLEDQRVVIEAA